VRHAELPHPSGGTSYCCITASALLGDYLGDKTDASRWLAQRQVTDGQGGFQGRPGKDEDVCYSFWCGAAARVSQ
jgi:geranylgeranyl transferase type-1 subunit beta